ncbi:MAG: D-alanine--D-alanine ligase [Xanthomonadales bacterium]|nr:D-alanine--D-alanine ligase [Xanthomonadales bacterium]
MRIERATDFGRVAVVMGGEGSEREVSLQSGAAVLEALQAREVNAFAVDGISPLLSCIQDGEVDRVFNILHGRGGEDGRLQGALDCLGVPYTGTGLLGSALAMDKSLSKRVWRDAGLSTARHAEVTPGQDALPSAQDIGFPLVVKPVSEGSSVGISMVADPADFAAALEQAFAHERRVMLERFIAGSELTVSILGGSALPAIRIETDREFYDYEAKYVSDDTRYLCPCGLDEAEEQALKQTALDAFALLNCQGWGRVDFMRDESGTVYLLEANTSPGMTSHSLVPKAAAAAGIDFGSLVWQILETSFDEVSP